MSAFRARFAVFVLLATLLAGPAGAAGVLHPFDDGACASHEDRTRVGLASDAPGSGNAHCVTCHLLRGVGGGVSTTVALGMAPQPAERSVPVRGADFTERPGATVSDRSPPSRR